MRFALALIWAPMLYLAACGGGSDVTGPPSGTLEISTSTTGPEPDPDGYTFQIDGGPITPIGSSASTSTELPAGTHSVRLTGLADNCSAPDNPRDVTVTGGQTTSSTFAVTCTPVTGSLTVIASTTGSLPDEDGYQVTVDGAESGALPDNGSLTLSGLPLGTHSVGLNGVAANCQVDGDNPRPVEITGGQTGSLSFTLVCTAPPGNAGTLQVVTVTSGALPDPDGYAFAMDGGTAQVIGTNTSVELANIPAGVHTVELSEVATNCVVGGANPRSVTVRAGATDEVRFTVTCGSSSALVWGHMDTGSPTYYLQGIWGSSPSDLFTVGETAGGNPTSAIFRFDGGRWTKQSTLPNSRLQAVWGSAPTDVFAVGFNAIAAGPGTLIYRYNGTSWTRMEDDAPLDDPLYLGVWGSSASDVYAVGEYFTDQDNTLVSHFDGVSWTQVPLDEPDFQIATDVHGSSATDVFVVGYRFPEDAYFVHHYNGAAWTLASFDGGVLSGVWASAPNDAFAVGFDEAGGFIIHYDGSLWSRMNAPPTSGLSDVWGSSGSDVYAVGEGTILHYDGSSWTQVSEEGEAKVFALSSTHVYVVGANGSVLHGTPQTAVASRESRVARQSRLLVARRPEGRELRGARSYGFPAGMPRPLSLERR